jgi:hypothetical protein
VPPPGTTPAPQGPVVAGPLPSPSPPDGTTATADGPINTSLSQPVKARRLGLPGALAAVLVAGVVVGVVRLAKAEFGGPILDQASDLRR